jgi:UDP-2-acetamido-3-amino-2,3-dideoxy-glucuronate N-acetyltransferase
LSARAHFHTDHRPNATCRFMPGQFCVIAPDVKLGRDVKIHHFVNLYGCEIGDASTIGSFVEIQKQARIGRNCKVSSHSFICEGVTIEDEVFIGHGVTFINDKHPRATTESGALQTESDWTVIPTLVKSGASIGSNASILCGITIGERAVVGAGAVVTRDVPAGATVAGNPAKEFRIPDFGLRDSD